MKATVIKAYTDRITGDIHLRGEEVELTEARAKELTEGGYVEAKAAPAKAEPTTKKAPAKKAAK